MSLPEPGSVTCRACGHEQPFTVWKSLNVTLDPEQKQELLDGRLTSSTCEQCGNTVQVVYDLLYHDMEQKLMIQLWPNAGDPPWMQRWDSEPTTGYTLRIVRSFPDLVERIRLFDAGLIDWEIEIFKALVRDQLGADHLLVDERLYFVRARRGENAEDVLEFESVSASGGRGFVLPAAMYRQVMAAVRLHHTLEEPSPGKWLRVDADFVSAMFEKASPIAPTDSTSGPVDDSAITESGRESGDRGRLPG